MSMNLRHAAALAFVGWYLMLLPKSDPYLGMLNVSWSAIQGSFDTAKDCEEARAKAVVPPLTLSLVLPSATPTPAASTAGSATANPLPARHRNES